MAAARACVICKNCFRYSRTFRGSSKKLLPVLHQNLSYRQYSTDPLPAPSSSPEKYPPHIEDIVASISKLTLLEVSDLNKLLKSRLNIKDAPVMMSGPATSVPAATTEEDVAPVVEQTEFSVKLLKFDDSKKVKLIKEIKSVMTDINLVQAKKFVESTPQIVKEKLSKEDADKLKAQLEAVGATVEIE